MELPEKKASRIKLSLPGDFSDESKWEEYFEWMKTVGENFKKMFPKYF